MYMYIQMIIRTWDREVARVEVALAVDGVELALRPQRVARVGGAARVVRQGAPLHPAFREEVERFALSEVAWNLLYLNWVMGVLLWALQTSW